MDARLHNAGIDKALAESGVLDHELFARLKQACNYDAASTMAWATACRSTTRNSKPRYP